MLYLASASPRRLELLQQLGIQPKQQFSLDIDETPFANEAPEAYVQRLALEKARAGVNYLQQQQLPAGAVLGSDTAVVQGEVIYGKPQDAEDAARMLHSLAGKTHEVMTAVAICQGEREVWRLSRSSVHFAALSAAQIQAYIATEEPFGKAGAYAIQGRAAAFIRHLEGSYSGVMGLPLYETAALLDALNISI